ncbi:hypothetical protein J2W91_005465 [Paenibacillus amylolyticus]|uniref:Uncharacterized protein n=1 Tax=Paenibacillus amylolyticus TaxID=1451 RepID=A0AAP5H831_PAEAM|nr:hypothetical protein [Paenibacillus amylolyticus]MDR6726940.1 hypothetical protein [Paenibacillus amylolyticus]
MKVWGIDLTVIIIALITAYIGYQFNHTSKKREAFLKELNNSYNEVYFPMFEQLQQIIELKDKTIKMEKVDFFMEEYSGKNSNIRFIASSFLLEYFYKLREVHIKYKQENNRINEKDLLKKIEGFHIMIENEYWDAHDIIYENHKQFVSDSFLNPFFVLIRSTLRVVYHLSVFLLWTSATLIYFTFAHIVSPLAWVPEWWNISIALLIFLGAVMSFGLMLMFKELLIKKNRRESRVVKKLKERLKKFSHRSI